MNLPRVEEDDRRESEDKMLIIATGSAFLLTDRGGPHLRAIAIPWREKVLGMVSIIKCSGLIF